MLVFLLSGESGSIWDRERHYYVGRDQFWAPPHTLIYLSVAGAGMLALAVVFVDTVRFYRGAPGVDDNSTVRIFKLFHAPLGFIIAGFGALQALTSAQLDNCWHTLYGIDIMHWAIRAAVVQQGMSYRVPGSIPYFNAIDALLLLIFIISALIVDGVAF